MFALAFAVLLLAAEVTADTVASVTLDAAIVTMLVSLVIPVLVGLLTKVNASPTVKQVANLVLSALNGIIVASITVDGSAVISKEAAFLALLSLGISIASYLGLYKPHDANAKLAPNSGLG